jgi:hypothetical protein
VLQSCYRDVYRGVTEVLQRCYRDVMLRCDVRVGILPIATLGSLSESGCYVYTEVLHRCYRGVTEVLQRCYRGVMLGLNSCQLPRLGA